MLSCAGYLVLLVGPSGVGKNTVISQIVEEKPLLKFVPSSTTRPMRPGEAEGLPYFFLTETEFQQQRDLQDVLEFQIVHGNYYWTSWSKIQKVWDQGRGAITDIDVFGALRLSALLPNRVLTIYLTASELDLQERIKQRHPDISEQELALRMGRMRFEESIQTAFSARIANEDLSVTVAKCLSTIERLGRISINHHELYEFDELDLLTGGLNCQGLCRFGIGREPSLAAAVSRQVRAIAYACHVHETPQVFDFELLPDAKVETNKCQTYTVRPIRIALV